MLEILVGSSGNLVLGWSGPGSKVVKKGSRLEGYFGTVEESDFVSSAELITQIGLFDTIPTVSPFTWIKFIYDNKVLFIPNRSPIEDNKTWEYFYTKGLVFGRNVLIGEELLNELGISEEIDQTKMYLIGDHYFYVRFPIFKDDQLYFDPSFQYRLETEDASEIKGTIFRVLSNYDTKVGKKAYEDLRSIVDHMSGYFVQALYPTGVGRANSRLNQDLLSSPLSINSAQKWIPVLELIPDKDVPAFPDVHHTRIGSLENTLPVNTSIMIPPMRRINPVYVSYDIDGDFLHRDDQLRGIRVINTGTVNLALDRGHDLVPYLVSDPVFDSDSVFKDYHLTPVATNHSPVNSDPFVERTRENSPLLTYVESSDEQVLHDKQHRSLRSTELSPISSIRIKGIYIDPRPLYFELSGGEVLESNVTHVSKGTRVLDSVPNTVLRQERIFLPDRITESIEQDLAADNKLLGRLGSTLYIRDTQSVKCYGKELGTDLIDMTTSRLTRDSVVTGRQNNTTHPPYGFKGTDRDLSLSVGLFEIKVI